MCFNNVAQEMCKLDHIFTKTHKKASNQSFKENRLPLKLLIKQESELTN